MNKFAQQYTHVASLFDARNIRERVLIGGLSATLIINIWLFLFHDHITTVQQKLDIQITTVEKQIETVEKQYDILVKAKRNDPNKNIKSRIQRTQQQIDILDSELQVKMKGLILPTQMAKILEQVLSQQTSLQFKRIQNLVTKPLLVNVPVDEAETEARRQENTNSQPIPQSGMSDIGVYQHGIEMEFSGSYLETLTFLKQLKRLPWNFYWDDVLFDVVKHPKSSVIIRVHTLSLREGWLGV